jgi:hypothetical protein
MDHLFDLFDSHFQAVDLVVGVEALVFFLENADFMRILHRLPNRLMILILLRHTRPLIIKNPTSAILLIIKIPTILPRNTQIPIPRSLTPNKLQLLQRSIQLNFLPSRVLSRVNLRLELRRIDPLRQQGLVRGQHPEKLLGIDDAEPVELEKLHYLDEMGAREVRGELVEEFEV